VDRANALWNDTRTGALELFTAAIPPYEAAPTWPTARGPGDHPGKITALGMSSRNEEKTVDVKLELVPIPVSDVDRATCLSLSSPTRTAICAIAPGLAHRVCHRSGCCLVSEPVTNRFRDLT
jgi:hypothetical protein